MKPETYTQTRERAKQAMLEVEFTSRKRRESLTTKMVLRELGMTEEDTKTFVSQLARAYDIEMMAEWSREFNPLPFWKRSKPEWRQWVEAIGWMVLVFAGALCPFAIVEALS